MDPFDDKQREQLSVKPATLPFIFDLFLKTRDKINPAGSSASSSASTASPPVSEPKGPSDADKAAAEKLKNTGNGHMASKDFEAAIEAYTKAADLDPANPVYYSNRAAAYSSKGDHNSAIVDANKALEADPSFVRAYHRLGYVPSHHCFICSITDFLPTQVTHIIASTNSKRRLMPSRAASTLTQQITISKQDYRARNHVSLRRMTRAKEERSTRRPRQAWVVWLICCEAWAWAVVAAQEARAACQTSRTY